MVVRTARAILPFLILAVATASARAQGTVLVEAGSSMKYIANQSDPGLTGLEWTEEGFKMFSGSREPTGWVTRTAPAP